MASRSNKRTKQSSNSSSCHSDSDEDSDYVTRSSQRLCRQESFTYSKDFQRKTASTLSGKHFCATTKKNNKQGEFPLKIAVKLVQGKAETSCLKVERLNFGRKKSSMSQRNRRFEDQVGKGNKIKEKKSTIFSWLIDSKSVVENEKVVYKDVSNQKTIKVGKIRREGILCSCCHLVFSAESFVFHGGRTTNEAYDLIFTTKQQLSLISCMVKAWNKPENRKLRKFNRIEPDGDFTDEYDDACIICADGGNLMCCDQCNSTYHQNCLGLEVVPRGSWYCPYCICKFCENPAHENDYLLECPQCAKKYHWECHQMRDSKIIDLNSTPCGPFCEYSCKEVHNKLEKNLVGVKNELEEGYSWSLLRRMDDDTGIYVDDRYKRTVCHSKLAVALRLMEDCFEPIIDRHTRIDIIPNVIYNCGSNFNRIDFRGFYTAILEKDDEITCVATLRIHGTNLAEMPFIATSEMHRCKGMCKKLMVAVESALCYLNVKNLIIPSTSERMSSWIEKFGFHLLYPAMRKEIILHNTLMFHDSTRLQKTLVSSHLAKPGQRSGGN